MVLRDKRSYDPGRWICQERAEHCNGRFRVYGENISCPLAPKCLHTDNKPSILEYLYKRHTNGMLCAGDPAHRGYILKRRGALIAAFDPETHKKYSATYREKNGEIRNAVRRAHRRQVYLERDAAEVAATDMSSAPPCGGDCRNCPYDNSCQYPDWDEKQNAEADAAFSKRQKKRQAFYSIPENHEKRNDYARQWKRNRKAKSKEGE